MSGPAIGSLFAGYGGLEQGVQAVLGGDVAWHSEIDPGACKILAHRYPGVPNLGDITAVDWTAVETVDVLTGGFPCQDVSAAGKRAGIRPDTRSGLWSQFAYAIDQLRPGLVVIENVRGLLSADAQHPAHSDLEPCDWCVGEGERRPLRALGAVLGELADLGYDASWHGLRAADVGAPHGRFRVFVVAWPAVPYGDARLAGTSAYPESHGRHEGRAKPARLIGRPDHALSRNAAQDADLAASGERRLAAPGQAEGGRPRTDAGGRGGAPVADPDGDGFGRLEELHGVPRTGREGDGHRDDADGLAVAAGGLDWGAYTAAVRRWEQLTRPAPNPTERGKNGQPRLSPAFVEWMQGLPAGWVTAVPGLTRNEQLKALGNGVVPQQAAQALRMLLPDVQAVAA